MKSRPPLLFSVSIALIASIYMTPLAHADRELNTIELKGGIRIVLPEQPSEPTELEAFNALSVKERDAFYLKRAWLVQKLAGGLAKPGIGSAIRWTKDKVTTVVRSTRNKFSVAERATGENGADLLTDDSTLALNGEKEIVEPVIEFETVPENISDKTKIFVETTITSLVNNMWANSAGIARSSGVGITLVAGVIWNTTLGKWGLIRGRSLSVDIGADFAANKGYINFFVDRQTKAAGGFSLDIGPMIDVMIHVTDPNTAPGETRTAVHQKLPFIGCFRSGPNYKAWGSQLGFHVVEMAAMVVTAMGYPEAGVSMVAVTRGIGMATVYRTNLERNSIHSVQVAPDHWLMEKLGFAKIAAKLSGKTCRSLFYPTTAI
ncbi:hypothetical protein BH10BDE1_BH10BDE1_17150 [soil metagenome]